MGARHFDLVSHWRLHASVETVWDVLTDVEDWPQWWPGLCSVHTLRAARPDGVGSVRRLEWDTGLPYRLRITVETVEVLTHERLRGRTRGTLCGDGLWLLRGRGTTTDVTYVWRVEPGTPWLRALAPLLAPVFRSNHHRLMRAGGAGLARQLARQSAADPVQAPHA